MAQRREHSIQSRVLSAAPRGKLGRAPSPRHRLRERLPPGTNLLVKPKDDLELAKVNMGEGFVLAVAGSHRPLGLFIVRDALAS